MRDYRAPIARGKAYVHREAVREMQILEGKIQAAVQGTWLYFVVIDIAKMDSAAWNNLRRQITSRARGNLDLLRGRLPRGISGRLTDRSRGILPRPREITFQCTCTGPHWMCAHVGAVLHSVGIELDRDPKLLFVLRGIEPPAPIQARASVGLDPALPRHSELLTDPDLEGIFGIELSDISEPEEDGHSEPREEIPPTPREPEPLAKKRPRPAAKRRSGSSTVKKRVKRPRL